MGTPRFTPEFKEEAVRQITERGYSVAEVSDRLGVSAHSLYKWLRAIINEHHTVWGVMTMCPVLNVARADIFNYIEVFYNRARRHNHLGGQSRGLRRGLIVRTGYVHYREGSPIQIKMVLKKSAA
jgi:hypothetical protein